MRIRWQGIKLYLRRLPVNEVKVGYAGFHWVQMPTGLWSSSPTGLGAGTPRITFRGGLIVGQAHTLSPENIGQDVYSLRDDFMGAVAEITGRRARAFMSQIDCDADIAIEFFLLEDGVTDVTQDNGEAP